MRKVLILLLGLVFVHPGSALALDLELRAGKVHGLFNFIGALKGWSARSPRLREIYEAAPESKAARAKEYLGDLDHLDQNFLQWEKFFYVQSILARDLADYDSRITGILPARDQQHLREILAYFQPIYEKLVWRPNEAKLRRYVQRLREATRKKEFAQVLQAVPKFYGPRAPQYERFVVGIVPLPGKKLTAYATSLGAVEAVEVAVDRDDLPGSLGVLLHEFCHSFSTVPDLSDEYRKLGGPYAAAAYRSLEEAIPTAIGNGLGYRALAGKLDPTSWYNDPVLDRFAHGLLPSIEIYLRDGRSIDPDFVARSTEIFRDQLGEQAFSFASLLNVVVLFSSWEDRFELSRTFRQEFTMNSIFHEQPIDLESGERELQENWTATRVAVVRAKDREAFATMAKRASIPADLAGEIAKSGGPGVWGGLDGGGRPTLIFRAENPSELRPLLQRLHERKALENAPGVRRLL